MYHVNMNRLMLVRVEIKYETEVLKYLRHIYYTIVVSRRQRYKKIQPLCTPSPLRRVHHFRMGYPLLVAYTVYALWRYFRFAHYRYTCGQCGAPLRTKGICPHCGTRNV